jgi:hypothetical protein
MEFDYKGFIRALPLNMHPLIVEKPMVRMKYLNVLAYFTEKYAKDDILAQAIFENYRLAFSKDGSTFQRFSTQQDVANLRNMLHTHLKHLKFFTFRYVLFCDLCAIIAPDNENTAKAIAAEIKMNIRKNSARMFDVFLNFLYHDNLQVIDKTKLQYTDYHLACWRQNRQYILLPERRVMVSSNVSSGKSTLINALIGKHINRSQNEACTTKLHYTYDKPFEDGFNYEYDYDLEMNADINTLFDDNPNNTSNIISVASYFRYNGTKNCRLCLIDSPGVNNSRDKTQDVIKEAIVSTDFDIFA